MEKTIYKIKLTKTEHSKKFYLQVNMNHLSTKQ